MRKLSLLLVFIILLLSSKLVQASTNTNSSLALSIPLPSIEINNNLNTYALNVTKRLLVKEIDQLLSVIEKANLYIGSLPVPPGYTCNTANDLSTLENYLNLQRNKIEAAETLSELRQIQRDSLQYLKANKVIIADSVEDKIDCSYRSSISAINAYLTYARLQSKIKELRGEDVSLLSTDITTAQEIVNESEEDYNTATSLIEKIRVYRMLKEVIPYLRSIESELN